MSLRASGPFDVQLSPLQLADTIAPTLGRMAIDKPEGGEIPIQPLANGLQNARSGLGQRVGLGQRPRDRVLGCLPPLRESRTSGQATRCL